MPTYDYQCRACATVTEVIHSMQEDGPSVCELCGGALRRVLFPTGIIFKGPGFYRNDSRASSPGTTDPSEKSGGSGKDAGSGSEQKPGSTTPAGSSPEAKAPTEASST